MKDIKTFAIGFLTCVCMFLIMGQTKQETEANMDANMEQVMKMANKMKDSGFMPEPVGRYQAYSAEGLSYMIETNTGFKYRFNPITKQWMKQSKEGDIFTQ